MKLHFVEYVAATTETPGKNVETEWVENFTSYPQGTLGTFYEYKFKYG